MIDARNTQVETRQGAFTTWVTPDDMELNVYLMLYGQARLVVGPRDSFGWDRGWCFHLTTEGALAAMTWDGDGDPPGAWYRSLHDGRRREFDDDGQLVREYVRS